MRGRFFLRLGSCIGAIVMALLLLYGLMRSVPDRSAALALRQGNQSLESDHYRSAIVHYDRVLQLVPNSVVARLGLACSYYFRGTHSTAALELTKGLEAGAFAGRFGHCGHGLNLDDVFFTAKLGLSDAFAVPRVRSAQRFERVLLSEPTGTTEDEPDRMLIGACLSLRADMPGVARVYVGNAIQTGAVDGSDREAFFACLDPRTRRREGCAHDPSILACVTTSAATSDYFRANHQANVSADPGGRS